MPTLPLETNVIRIYKITRACYAKDWSRFALPTSLWNSVAKEKPFKMIYLDINDHYGLWICASSFASQQRAEQTLEYAYGAATASAILKVPLEKGSPIHYEFVENAIV